MTEFALTHRPASVPAPTRLSPLRRCSLCLLHCCLLLLHPLRVFACPLHPPYLVSTRPLRPQSLPRPPSECVNASTRTLSALTRLRPPSLPPQLVSARPLLLQSLLRPPFPPSPRQRQCVPSQHVNVLTHALHASALSAPSPQIRVSALPLRTPPLPLRTPPPQPQSPPHPPSPPPTCLCAPSPRVCPLRAPSLSAYTHFCVSAYRAPSPPALSAYTHPPRIRTPSPRLHPPPPPQFAPDHVVPL
ncbi:uncharacterized protein STEHIDRAFT_151329 [Stereum hirsutum FP-91666 SS1]|uniref:uncharacterized protein n=1 Tax=Stereum hirsutum (strain FP-91666) TaxID=721885 RepID=UPI000440E3EF|nr:uncharacterized protein STEHIDRAFT_151329 [Stereum hirsutum FP-91666 SS1]EIM91977.1 hypothetical protein STEHIDRAFT_151329 [Stereum hirsutum FP-91666 SS1]